MVHFCHGKVCPLNYNFTEYLIFMSDTVDCCCCCCVVTSVVSLCDPIRGSPPGSPVPGILQARTLEWVAISFSNTCKWKVKVKSLSRVQLLRPHGLQPTRLISPWNFPDESTGVGVPLPSPDTVDYTISNPFTDSNSAPLKRHFYSKKP